MLFFPPPPPASSTTDLVVSPAAVDGLLLSGALMPSLLEQEQRNQQLQRHLVMMEQQLQQQHQQQQIHQPSSALIPPFPNVHSSFIFPPGASSIDNTLLAPIPDARLLQQPISAGISPCSAVVPDGTLTQLVPSTNSQQQPIIETINHNNNNNNSAPSAGPQLSLQPTGPCSACHQPIVEKSFLLVDGQSWHPECVRCVVCGQNLEGQGPTCFVRDGFLFCRRDYFDKFGTPCERCGVPIARGEMVMRVPRVGPAVPPDHEALFHVQCFSCICCNEHLSPGQQYTVGPIDQSGGPLFCNAHFHLNPLAGILGQFPPIAHDASGDERTHFLAAAGGGGVPQLNQTVKVLEQLSMGQNSPPPPGIPPNADTFRESGQENADGNRLSSISPNGTTDGQYGPNGCGGSSNGGDDDTPGMGGSNCGRQKRMRTSFKHHQLRTMKTYFSLNHNPDAKDLKSLAQKTGLTKRVLQVWFQNARAKYRRNQQHRSGGIPGDMQQGTPAGMMAMAGGDGRHNIAPQGANNGGGYAPNGGIGTGGEIMLTLPPGHHHSLGPSLSALGGSTCSPSCTASLDECSSMITSASFSSSSASDPGGQIGGAGGGDQNGER